MTLPEQIILGTRLSPNQEAESEFGAAKFGDTSLSLGNT